MTRELHDDDARAEALVERALQDNAALGPALAAVRALASRALEDASDDVQGDAPARYHGLIYRLHTDAARGTYARRRLLAEAGYEVEERLLLARGEPYEPTAGEFRAEVVAALDRKAKHRHPMMTYMFDGEPSWGALQVYMEHHWFRSRAFHRELTEFSLTRSLAHASAVCENLFEEMGERDPAGAHPFLLQRLLRHMEVPCSFEDHPTWPEAHAYLNNRVRCARNPEPAWGLSVLLALEYGTPAVHGGIYALLRRRAVPEEFCEFHRVHMLGDEAHADALFELVDQLITSDAQRRVFMRSLARHRELGARYLDRVWAAMQARSDDGRK